MCPHGTLSLHEDFRAFPPKHVVGFLQQVVTHPTGNGKHVRVFSMKILLAPDFDHHALHLIGDLVVLFLLVFSGVAVHLVLANVLGHIPVL